MQLSDAFLACRQWKSLPSHSSPKISHSKSRVERGVFFGDRDFPESKLLVTPVKNTRGVWSHRRPHACDRSFRIEAIVEITDKYCGKFSRSELQRCRSHRSSDITHVTVDACSASAQTLLDPRMHRSERRIEIIRVAAAGLSHVGASAAATADLLRHGVDELACLDA